MLKNAHEQPEQDAIDNTSVRDKLIAVAAFHFAEHGLLGASQRAIQREVGVNPGAAHYYFGSKEALYLAVIDDFLQRSQAERLANLQALPAEGSFAERLRYLLRSYLAPLLSDADTKRGHSYLRIVVAQLAHADIGMEAMEAQLQELREQYVEQLSRMFPAVPRNRIEEVLRACVSIAAAMPIQLKPEALNKQKIDAMIEDVTEIAAMVFERLCDPHHP